MSSPASSSSSFRPMRRQRRSRARRSVQYPYTRTRETTSTNPHSNHCPDRVRTRTRTRTRCRSGTCKRGFPNIIDIETVLDTCMLADPIGVDEVLVCFLVSECTTRSSNLLPSVVVRRLDSQRQDIESYLHIHAHARAHTHADTVQPTTDTKRDVTDHEPDRDREGSALERTWAFTFDFLRCLLELNVVQATAHLWPSLLLSVQRWSDRVWTYCILRGACCDDIRIRLERWMYAQCADMSTSLHSSLTLASMATELCDVWRRRLQILNASIDTDNHNDNHDETDTTLMCLCEKIAVPLHFVCRTCQDRFSSIDALVQHVLTHRASVCPPCVSSCV